MEKISRTKIVDLLKREDFGAMVNVKGWVRTRRGSKQVNFIALNDGSTINNVQIVVDLGNFDEEMLKEITTGACLSVNGVLTESVGSGQKAEVQAREIEVLGTCDNTYPLQKKGHSMEFLREIAHLRPRTNTFGAVFRIRHNMAIAIHKFFHDRGFFYFHTPIITASDCEGAGQMFQVTTKNLYDLKKDENGSIIYDDDFFGKQASLTVSGQLEGELAATALGAIYTFGPTFRAENSNTPRHLAEFWSVYKQHGGLLSCPAQSAAKSRKRAKKNFSPQREKLTSQKKETTNPRQNRTRTVFSVSGASRCTAWHCLLFGICNFFLIF